MSSDMNVCITQTLPPWGECDTRLIFKQSKAGLNLELSFS